MKKILWIAVAVVVILVIFGYWFMPKEARYSDYAFLIQPRIADLPDQKVIMVKAVGDPNKTSQYALGILFRTYYKLGKAVRENGYKAPKARWSWEDTTQRETWEGQFAIQVPETVNEIPGIDDKSGLKAELTTWNYGTVAEILHVGPYGKEKPTVEKLMNFISESGYEIAGPHEEEYLKGPMPFLPTNPEKYLTIIRYQVRKRGS